MADTRSRDIRHQRRLWIVLLVVGLSIGVYSATNRSVESAKATPHTISPIPHPYDPDWPDVFLILANKCASCHRPGEEHGDFTSYAALLAARDANDMPMVVPGHAAESPLWHQTCWNAAAKVNNNLPDTPNMPPDKREWLTVGQQETLRRWINGGALQYKLPDHCNTSPLLEIDFPSAKQCAGCHPKQYDEWSRSMHAYAQHSPITEAFNLTLMEKTSGTIGTFCTRCHTPVGTAIGEPGALRNVHRSRSSMEGVTCIACHRRKDGRYKASGRVRVEPGKLVDACMFGPFDDAVEVDGRHPTAKLTYIKSSQFCGECHDVTSPEAVRLEEAFAEWQNSPAAKAGITCQNCHMGPVQGIPIADCDRPLGRAAQVPGVPKEKIPLRRLSDHTFAGPDYSLLPDTEFPHKRDWMYEKDYRDTASLTPFEQRSLDQLRRENRASLKKADEKRYELLSNAVDLRVTHCETAHVGERIKITAEVISKLAGHSFPTGFTAERQAWVFIQVCDPEGRVIFASGDLDKNGDLRDDHSHAVLTGKVPYDKHLLNFQSKFINLTNKGTERSVIVSVNRHLAPLNIIRPAVEASASFGRPPGFRVAKGSLPPLKTIRKNYPVVLPKVPGAYKVRVEMNFRHLPPTLLDHIGVPNLKHLLEVVVLDQYDGVIYVTP